MARQSPTGNAVWRMSRPAAVTLPRAVPIKAPGRKSDRHCLGIPPSLLAPFLSETFCGMMGRMGDERDPFDQELAMFERRPGNTRADRGISIQAWREVRKEVLILLKGIAGGND